MAASGTVKSHFCDISIQCRLTSGPFLLRAISSVKICEALKAIDPKKSPRPDSLEANLLKAATGYTAEPIAHVFNQSLQTNFFSKQRKAAGVLPLLKEVRGG